VLYNDTQCLAVEQTQTVVVVETALVLENPVSQICTDMLALLKAMSDALTGLSRGSAVFVTSVTVLDSQPCVSNQCPQCNASRRLLGSGVNLVTESKSTVSTASSNSTQTSTPLLSTVLQSTLTNLSFQPRSIAVQVAQTVEPIPQPLLPRRRARTVWQEHGELLFLIINLSTVVGIAVFFLFHFMRRKTTEALAYCGIFAGVRLLPPRRANGGVNG